MRGSGDFLQSRFNVKIHVQVNFVIASQFYVRVDVEFYMHVFIHLYGGEIRYVKTFTDFFLLLPAALASNSSSHTTYVHVRLDCYCRVLIVGGQFRT